MRQKIFLLIIIFKIGWVGLIKCINTVIKLIAVIFNFFLCFENFIHRIRKKLMVVGNKNLLGLNYANYFYS